MKQAKILFILMLLAPVAASAQETFMTADSVKYMILSENTVSLVDAMPLSIISVSKTYSIPPVVSNNGIKYTVTEIGDNAFFCTEFKSISIPTSIKHIGNGAFYCCIYLESITIPSTVKSIGGWAFYGCPFKSLMIPSSVDTIGVGAFSYCYDLESISLPANIKTLSNRLFEGSNHLQQINIPENVTTIGDCAFLGCESLKEVTIPQNVIAIGESAFGQCSALQKVTIPESVKSIGKFAFDDCSNLTSLAIPNGVTEIGNGAFYGCSSLQQIAIPNGVTEIGTGVFYGCSSLHSIDLPNNLVSIGDQAFSDSGLKSVVLPSGLISIGYFAFECDSLVSVVSNMKKPFEIDQNTFCAYDHEARTFIPSKATLYIPEGTYYEYEEMGWTKQFAKVITGNFFDESGTTYQAQAENTVAVMGSGVVEAEYVIPETVTHDGVDYTVTAIENEAFKDNTALTAVTIPETVVAIGEGAFAGCTGLTAIYAYAAEPANLATATTRAEAASSVFEGVDKETCVLYVPKGCVEKYRAAVGWGEFIHIEEMEGTGISSQTIIDRKAFDVYDMSGRKVRTAATSLNGLPKGVYIVNGRKVLLAK